MTATTWTYSDIRRVPQIPPCPDCSLSTDVVQVTPGQPRWRCVRDGVEFTAIPKVVTA